MGPHATLTPKIFKLNVYMYEQFKGLMIFGVPHYMNPEQCVLTFTPWYTVKTHWLDQ